MLKKMLEIKKDYMETKQLILNEVYELSDGTNYVNTYRNSTLFFQIDFTQIDLEVNSIHGVLDHINQFEIKEIIKLKNQIDIICRTGDIFVIKRSELRYITRHEYVDAIENICSEYGKVKFQEYKYEVDENGLCNKVETVNKFKSLNELMEEASEFVEKIDFNGLLCLCNDEMLYHENLIEGTAFKISVPDEHKFAGVKEVNLIQTDSFRSNMRVYIDNFIIPYWNIISYININELLHKKINQMVIELPFNIGYRTINKILDIDNDIYIQNEGNLSYSFTIKNEDDLTNKCVVILRKKDNSQEGYYIEAIFPI